MREKFCALLGQPSSTSAGRDGRGTVPRSTQCRRSLMQKALGLVLAGLGAAAIAGAAVAANRDSHIMNVPLPDGSTARVEYVGDVAPKVTVVPDAVVPFGMF